MPEFVMCDLSWIGRSVQMYKPCRESTFLMFWWYSLWWCWWQWTKLLCVLNACSFLFSTFFDQRYTISLVSCQISPSILQTILINSPKAFGLLIKIFRLNGSNSTYINSLIHSTLPPSGWVWTFLLSMCGALNRADVLGVWWLSLNMKGNVKLQSRTSELTHPTTYYAGWLWLCKCAVSLLFNHVTL